MNPFTFTINLLPAQRIRLRLQSMYDRHGGFGYVYKRFITGTVDSLMFRSKLLPAQWIRFRLEAKYYRHSGLAYV